MLSKSQKTTLMASFGAGLEYYDFIIYMMLSMYIGELFFPTSDKAVAAIHSLGVFAIGYLSRPIGGIIFGFLGDRYGRKIPFLTAIVLMAAATVSIGLLPTYASLGYKATLLLILCRIVQGISFGAEMPGAITFISEHAGSSNRGTHLSFMMMQVSLGALLSSAVVYVLTGVLDKQEMLQWGWRLPFVFGGLLAIAAFFLRRGTDETPLFLKYKASTQVSILTVLKQYPAQLAQGMVITLFSGSLIILALYFPTYLNTYFDFSTHEVYRAMLFSLIWSALMLPVMGWLSDQIGRKSLMVWTTLLVLVSMSFLFSLMTFHSLSLLLLFMCLYQTMVAALAACYPAMLAELFPTEIRYIGVALCYNLAYSLAGLMPMMAAYLLNYTGYKMSMSWILSSLSVLCLIACVRIQDRTQRLLQ